MKLIWLISLVFLAFGCAKDSEGEDVSADAAAEESKEPVANDIAAPDDIPFEFANNEAIKRNGTGRGYPEFDLKEGGVIFKYSNKGPGARDFKITISDGIKEIDAIAEDAGEVSGRHFAKIDKEGNHKVLFDTSDNWEIETVTPKILDSKPKKFSGIDNDVSDIFFMARDEKIFITMKRSGDGVCNLVAYDASTGERIKVIAENEAGDFQKTFHFSPEKDTYVLLAVESKFSNSANGSKSWSIDIK
jgi:hypothetical protein